MPSTARPLAACVGLSLAALVAALPACSPGCGAREAPRSAASASRPIVLGTLEEPDTLDPLFTELAGAQEVVRLLFRDLTDYDPSWRIHPSLAAALPAVESSTTGGLVARWRLRDGLRWSDGAPLTAEDVAFGWRIARDPTLDVTSRQMTAEIASVRAISPLELAVEWRRPYPALASPRVHPILPRHAYPDPATSPRPFRGLGRAPVSSGPYRLAEWVPGQFLRLEPNPHWPLEPPTIPSITFRFFRAEDSFEAELRTGGIDALGEASGLSIERAEGLAERLGGTHVVEHTDSGLWLHLEVRADHPALRDVRVRRALSLAIDRDVMAKLVYGGRARPAYGCFPPRHPAHGGAAPFATDRAEAARLLDSAGFRASPSGGARTSTAGVRLALELELASGSQASERAATFVQAELAKVGVDVTLRALPMRVVFAKLRERTHAPLVLFAWRSSPDWDANAMLRSGGAQAYGGLADAALDELLDRAKTETDPARWADALRRVERRYAELLPSIPLLFRSAVSVRPKDLEGWAPTGTSTPVTWNAERWRWK
ncbi:peptide ABC transporter substrate-binding protein [Myxococcota bacterium]|nr:peptide ABC transporter substrate-binding protein [Myxococcota bacterium]